MTSPLPQSHITDLLPAYLNGTLDTASQEQVRIHLIRCEYCQRELASWETLKDTTQMAMVAAPTPSLQLMDAVWEKIEAQEKHVEARPRLIPQPVLHLGLVLRKQVALIHKSIWIVSALVGLFACALILFAAKTGHVLYPLQEAKEMLAFFTTVVAATGVAFIYQAENDASYEITLSTPTSIRIVMICRMVLVIGYNFALAALTSIIIALALGGGIWDIIQFWLGPMLLLSSISLTLSLMVGSAVGVVFTFIIEILQTIPQNLARSAFWLQFVRPDNWQTTPMVLLLAVLFFLFAIYYAPRQPRISR